MPITLMYKKKRKEDKRRKEKNKNCNLVKIVVILREERKQEVRKFGNNVQATTRCHFALKFKQAFKKLYKLSLNLSTINFFPTQNWNKFLLIFIKFK